MESNAWVEGTSREVKGRTSGIFGLEGIGLLLTATFVVRVLGDIIRRATNGRALGRTHEMEVDSVWDRVVGALTYVEQLLEDKAEQGERLNPLPLSS